MIFLGYAFAGGIYSLDSTPITQRDNTSIVISNGIFGELYATSKTEGYSTVIPEDWSFDTLFHARFDGNLLAGNVNFAASEVKLLRLKRRIKGKSQWTTIYEQIIKSAEDFSFEWLDKTARANTTYEYTIVPVFDKVEGSLFTNEITTDFNGLFIMDKDNIFATELDVVISEKRNKPRNIITTINRKYPYVISNGSNDYDSGSVSAQWLEYDYRDDSWDNDNRYDYVRNLKDFLNNGSAKLLKYEDGRMWLIDISSSEIVDSEDDGRLQVHTSFDWVEIGDCDSGVDLYYNNLIDAEVI